MRTGAPFDSGAVQTLAAAAIMEVTGARNPWVRALVGAATAGAGAMLYAPSGIGPGLGSPFFASVTVGSGTGVLLQSARALKPSRPWWLYPGAYVLGVWLVWMVHILF